MFTFPQEDLTCPHRVAIRMNANNLWTSETISSALKYRFVVLTSEQPVCISVDATVWGIRNFNEVANE
jgi:hypothetical protein